MGYAGATYLVQEYCNALFDALFHILPLGDGYGPRRIATPVQGGKPGTSIPGTTTRCTAAGRATSSQEPFLVRISAAKRLRDRVERDASDGDGRGG